MSGSRAQVLFIGTQADIFSAIERWPMVKALEQFGTLSGVNALTLPAQSSTRLGRASPHTRPTIGPERTM
jgi:hypothetical protein